MSKKKEIAYEYSKRVSRGNPMTKDLAECAFIVGWDACLKHLGEIPWDEAMNEIANHISELKESCLLYTSPSPRDTR